MAPTTWNPSFEEVESNIGEASCPLHEKACPPARNPVGAGGLRLSWPQAGDGRRAIVGKSPTSVKKSNSKGGEGGGGPHVGDTRIVHVSHRDVELHYHFTSSVPSRCTRPVLDVPLAWNSVKLEIEHQQLFHHFQHAASKSLAVFGHDPAELGNALIRIALANNTTSATAVLRSLLALSALHSNDVHSQAVELKLSALRALMAVSGGDIGATEAIQHVAAGMLLCSFEIHRASCTSGEWTWYLRGVKDVIQVAGLYELEQDGDLAILLDWVYYHDVLARFSLRHWHGSATTRDSSSSSVASSPSSSSSAPSSIRAQVSRAASPAVSVIELLSDVCDAISASPRVLVSAEHVHDQNNFLKILDWRIRNSMQQESHARDNADAPLIMELYHLAMLVYLGLASGNLLNQGPRTHAQIARAFAIITQLGSCDRQFPVFILGCEARSDDQRAAILDLISRTEGNVASRSFNYVRLLLQAIWAQDDLADGDAANYWDKLSYVISCCRILPTFV